MAQARGAGLETKVARAVIAHLPGRQVLAVADEGEWVRRRYRVTLDGDEKVLVKLSTHPEWIDGSRQEAEAARLMAAHGLPAAPVLALETALPSPLTTICSGPRFWRAAPAAPSTVAA
jgi:hypothetical protein